MKNRRGITLIEVIVSIAIIGIISTSLLTIFNTGVVNIVNAGKRTEELFVIKNKIEDKMIEPIINALDGEDTILEEIQYNKQISISGLGTSTIDIPGKFIIIKSPIDSKYNIIIDAFIPD